MNRVYNKFTLYSSTFWK